MCGAGPTGLTLAVDLARRGIACTVLEQADRLFVGSRGIGPATHDAGGLRRPRCPSTGSRRAALRFRRFGCTQAKRWCGHAPRHDRRVRRLLAPHSTTLPLSQGIASSSTWTPVPVSPTTSAPAIPSRSWCALTATSHWPPPTRQMSPTTSRHSDQTRSAHPAQPRRAGQPGSARQLGAGRAGRCLVSHPGNLTTPSDGRSRDREDHLTGADRW